MIVRRHCELCNGEATVFCSADNAYLCRSCDSQVHQANFLVARHVRQHVCFGCNNLTGHTISGVGFDQLVPPTCPSCPPPAEEFSSLSSDSSVCISSTTSPAYKKSRCGGGRTVGQSVDSSSSSSVTSSESSRRERKSRVDIFEAEGVFVNWYGKLGVGDDVAVRMASRAMRVFLDRLTTALPFRICLAASVWHGLRFSHQKSMQTWQLLKRLEEISGAPAKIILAAASKLERAVRVQRRRRLELEEGWAEC